MIRMASLPREVRALPHDASSGRLCVLPTFRAPAPVNSQYRSLLQEGTPHDTPRCRKEGGSRPEQERMAPIASPGPDRVDLLPQHSRRGARGGEELGLGGRIESADALPGVPDFSPDRN